MSRVHANVAGMYLVLASHLGIVSAVGKNGLKFAERDLTSASYRSTWLRRKHHRRNLTDDGLVSALASFKCQFVFFFLWKYLLLFSVEAYNILNCTRLFDNVAIGRYNNHILFFEFKSSFLLDSMKRKIWYMTISTLKSNTGLNLKGKSYLLLDKFKTMKRT